MMCPEFIPTITIKKAGLPASAVPLLQSGQFLVTRWNFSNTLAHGRSLAPEESVNIGGSDKGHEVSNLK